MPPSFIYNLEVNKMNDYRVITAEYERLKNEHTAQF